MNKVILLGRLTRDPDIRWTQGQDQNCIARFTLAVDRRFKQEGQQAADFISCVAFGKTAEFAEKYLRQGTKIAVTGRIQTESYTNRDGQKVYTTDVVVEECEFAESKKDSGNQTEENQGQQNREQQSREPQREASYRQKGMTMDHDGFMNIPDGIDEELPFN